jgi:long-chain-fatty-acid--CoA ligase ACSBG
MDDLTSDCIKLLQSIGSTATKVSQIFENKADPVYLAIESGFNSTFDGYLWWQQRSLHCKSFFHSFVFENQGIQRANTKAVSNVAKIKKFSILPKDFSLPSGELGSTFKLRRPIVVAKYTDLIESMYKDSNAE